MLTGRGKGREKGAREMEESLNGMELVGWREWQRDERIRKREKKGVIRR